MPYQILTPEGWRNILPEHKGDKPHKHPHEEKTESEKEIHAECTRFRFTHNKMKKKNGTLGDIRLGRKKYATGV